MTISDCVFRYSNGRVEIATGGDFRKGHITFSKEEFEDMFMSNAIEILKHKPKNPIIKNYLLNVTFYAGSNDKEDTDRDLFLLCVDKEVTETEMKNIFKEVNRHLDTFAQEIGEVEFSISYEQGLNINTLMEGVGIYTKGKVVKINDNCGQIKDIDNYYTIEQWQ